MVEILVFVILVIVLDIAAMVWGVDSRELFKEDPNTQSRPRRAI